MSPKEQDFSNSHVCCFTVCGPGQGKKASVFSNNFTDDQNNELSLNDDRGDSLVI